MLEERIVGLLVGIQGGIVISTTIMWIAGKRQKELYIAGVIVAIFVTAYLLGLGGYAHVATFTAFTGFFQLLNSGLLEWLLTPEKKEQ